MGALWPVCLQQRPCSLLLENGEWPGDGTSRPRQRPEATGLGPRPPTAPPAPGTRGPALRPAFHWGLWRMRGWVQGSRNCCAHLGPLPGPCPPRGPPPPAFFMARRLPSFCRTVPTGSYFKLGFVAALGTHAARPARAGAFARFCKRQSLPLAGSCYFCPHVSRARKRGGKG